jgi:hypothetical protein
MTICAELVKSVADVLAHVQEVENSIIDLSKEATLQFSKAVENSDIALSDEFMSALQYQDILSQQLSATVEAMNITATQITTYIDNFECEDKLDVQSVQLIEEFKHLGATIQDAVKTAKIKQETFGGKVLNSDASQDIEFF